MSKIDEIVSKLSSMNLPDVDFDAYYKMQEDDTQKLRRVVDYYDEIENFIEKGEEVIGAKLPFNKLNKLFRFRDGEVTLWTGFNGHKKSLLLGYVALEFIKHHQKVCVASFEMKPLSTISRMTRQYNDSGKLGYDEFANFMSFAGQNLYLFDHQGGMTPERLLGVIYYAANELGVKHFVIDSLMRVVAGEDKYNEQKDFVVKLCDIAIKKNIHIHLVHHTRKGKENEPSSRYDAKGSGAISDNVHNSLIVWSNKDKIADMPDAILKCDKQREGEWEGKLALRFDSESLRFEEQF
jgi:twinkle protein